MAYLYTCSKPDARYDTIRRPVNIIYECITRGRLSNNAWGRRVGFDGNLSSQGHGGRKLLFTEPSSLKSRFSNDCVTPLMHKSSPPSGVANGITILHDCGNDMLNSFSRHGRFVFLNLRGDYDRKAHLTLEETKTVHPADHALRVTFGHEIRRRVKLSLRAWLFTNGVLRSVPATQGNRPQAHIDQ